LIGDSSIKLFVVTSDEAVTWWLDCGFIKILSINLLIVESGNLVFSQTNTAIVLIKINKISMLVSRRLVNGGVVSKINITYQAANLLQK
jgi:hypothetical protein